MKTLLACLLLTAFAAPAIAAESASDPIAPPDCKKPLQTSSIRKADDPGEFDTQFEEYQTCVKTYVDEQQALSAKHVNAANAAITDLNAFIAKVNETRKKN